MSSSIGISSLALLIHQNSNNNTVDVTVHNVHYARTERDEHVIGEGRVLGDEEKSELVAILNNDESQAFTLQSDKVLAQNAYGLAWWTPKAQRELIFKNDHGDLKRLTVTFPNMVGVCMRGNLHFAVTKGGAKSRPNDDTPLFNIPLPNLYDNGRFCRGNIQHPTNASTKNIGSWESVVFDTVNTHLGSVQPFKGLLGNMDSLIDIYKKAEEEGRFPTARLEPMDFTLGEWLAHLDKGGKV